MKSNNPANIWGSPAYMTKEKELNNEISNRNTGNTHSGQEDKTWYVRDTTGNVAIKLVPD